MRNHEHYIDKTAGEAIRRACAHKKKGKPWGAAHVPDRGAYVITLLRWTNIINSEK